MMKIRGMPAMPGMQIIIGMTRMPEMKRMS